MKILVLGAGAVGGYFGGRMAEAGMDVTFLVREKRQKKLEKSGLIIKSPKGDFAASPNLVTIDNVDSIYDLILFTNKAVSYTHLTLPTNSRV